MSAKVFSRQVLKESPHRNVKPAASTWSEIKDINADQNCLVSRKLSELSQVGGLSSIISFFQSACDSSEFAEKCDELGLREGNFNPNDLLRRGHPSYDKLDRAITEIDGDARLGVVFHGTPSKNIEVISANGLDPSKRKCQVYGPGEYFAKTPRVSVSYCQGGSEMMVFVVVIPGSVVAKPKTVKKKLPGPWSCSKCSYVNSNPTTTQCTICRTKRAASTSSKTVINLVGWSCNRCSVQNDDWINKCRACGTCKPATVAVAAPPPPKHPVHSVAPSNFVVVNNNNHQIPIGSFTFESVDQGVLLASQQLRDRLVAMAKDAEAKLLGIDETKKKAVIIQNLIAQKFDEASKAYMENLSILTDLSKREIAWYVKPFITGDPRFETFFPNLPPPLDLDELNKSNIQSVEIAVKQESRLQRDIARTQKALAKKEEKEKKEGGNNASKTDPANQQVWVAPKRGADPRKVLQKILDNMTKDRMDVAAELYSDKASILDGFAKREIAKCVYRKMENEKDMIPVLFPDLPDPAEPPCKKQKEDQEELCEGLAGI